MLYMNTRRLLRVKIDIKKWQLLEEASLNEESPHLQQLLRPFEGNGVECC